MGVVSMKQLLEAGVHFGHQTTEFTSSIFRRQLRSLKKLICLSVTSQLMAKRYFS